MKTIMTQDVLFTETEVLSGLTKIDKGAKIQMNRLIYYPYYFFEFDVKAKSLLNFEGRVGCTIDALGGHGAIVDIQPNLIEIRAECLTVPTIAVVKSQAAKKAKRFVFESASSKAKFLTIPIIKCISSQLFYRPFWIADYKNKEAKEQLIVDAVSGSYHPL